MVWQRGSELRRACVPSPLALESAVEDVRAVSDSYRKPPWQAFVEGRGLNAYGVAGVGEGAGAERSEPGTGPADDDDFAHNAVLCFLYPLTFSIWRGGRSR